MHVDGLTHDRIEGQLVGVIDMFIPGQPPELRLPEQTIDPIYPN